MKNIFLLILIIINCSVLFSQKAEYDKVSFVNENNKDTTYMVFYDNDTKECINESIIATPPGSTTIIAYPKTKKVSVEQSDSKKKVIEGLEAKKIIGIEKIKENDKIKEPKEPK